MASTLQRLSEEQEKFCKPTNLNWKNKRGLEERTAGPKAEQATEWGTGEAFPRGDLFSK